MLIIVLPIIEHSTRLSWTKPIESIHQCRFARARTSNESHKLTRWNNDRNVIDENGLIVARLLKAKSINTNTIAFILLSECCPGEYQTEGTNTNFIVGYQVMWMLDKFRIDIHMVRTTCVYNTVST